MTIIIYHNPRCSKSRKTLELLQANSQDPQIHEYLKQPVAADTLAELANKLGVQAEGIMRSGEEEFREQREALSNMTETEKFAWLAAHPKVLQRPIVVAGDQARIGRPPENVLEILPPL